MEIEIRTPRPAYPIMGGQHEWSLYFSFHGIPHTATAAALTTPRFFNALQWSPVPSMRPGCNPAFVLLLSNIAGNEGPVEWPLHVVWGRRSFFRLVVGQLRLQTIWGKMEVCIGGKCSLWDCIAAPLKETYGSCRCSRQPYVEGPVHWDLRFG